MCSSVFQIYYPVEFGTVGPAHGHNLFLLGEILDVVQVVKRLGGRINTFEEAILSSNKHVIIWVHVVYSIYRFPVIFSKFEFDL